MQIFTIFKNKNDDRFIFCVVVKTALIPYFPSHIFHSFIHSLLLVMLTKLEEKQQECSYLYWSDLESRRFGEITIELIKKKEEIDYLHRQFKISHSEVSLHDQPTITNGLMILQLVAS